MIEDAFIAEMRAALERRRDEIADLRRSSEGSRATVELDQTRVGRLSRMDALQGQAMASAQEDRRRQELARIEAALARIEADTFGECMRCGYEIDPGRLRTDPAAPLCMDCASG